MRKIIVSALFVTLILSGCNLGLAPNEEKLLEKPGIHFPIETTGGDPTGTWMPLDQNAVEARLVDPQQIKDMVDSLELATTFVGQMIFGDHHYFQFNGYLAIAPTVKVGNVTLTIPPFTEVFNDTGVYEQILPNVLSLPLQTKTFKIDTVGYSVQGDTLTLVTLPSIFPYQGFEFVEYYMIFQFKQSASVLKQATGRIIRRKSFPR